MQLAQTLFLLLALAFIGWFWKTENVNSAVLAFFFFCLGIV